MRVLRAACLALCFAAPAAQGAILCSVTVNSISVFYNPAGGDVSTSAFYTINCTRTLTSEGPTVTYSLTANDGLHAQGSNRQVALSGSFYKYGLYKNNGFGPNDQWGTPSPASRAITGTLTFGASALSVTTGGTLYFLQVLGGQPVGPAGVYTDAVVATLTYSPGPGIPATTPFTVSVTSITNCAVIAPASLAFNYTSFQGTAATPSANFTVNCTTGTPYTIALDSTGPITDNAVNLTYSLGLSAAAATGTGVNQTFQVTGNMAAGQSGNCVTSPCTNAAATNKTRSITVTY